MEDGNSGLPFHFSDYLELVDWTGRAIRSDKRGRIPENVPPILNRLGVETESWIDTVRHFRLHFYDCVGPPETMERCSRTLGRYWLRGAGLVASSGAARQWCRHFLKPTKRQADSDDGG